MINKKVIYCIIFLLFSGVSIFPESFNIYYSIEDIKITQEDNMSKEYSYIGLLIKKSLDVFLEEKLINIDNNTYFKLLQNTIAENDIKGVYDYPFPIDISIDNYKKSNFKLKNNSQKSIYNLYIDYSIKNVNSNFFDIKLDLQIFNKLLNISNSHSFVFNIKREQLSQDINEKVVIKIAEKFTKFNYYKIELEGDKDYFVKINNKIIGKLPIVKYIKEGDVKIEYFLDGYKTVFHEFVLKNDYKKEVKLDKIMKTGFLKINTYPMNSQIYIDNNYIGNSPLRKFKLIPGKYILSIYYPGYEIKKLSIEIKKGEEVYIKKMLNPKGTTEYYNSLNNSLLNIGISNYKYSTLFFAGGIASYLSFNYFYLKALEFPSFQNYLGYNISAGIGFVSLGFSLYYFVKGCIFLYNAYDMIKDDQYIDYY